MSGRALTLLLCAALLAGCGVDTNSLICSPGKEREGSTCVVPEDDDARSERCVSIAQEVLDAEAERLAVPDEEREPVGGFCADWLDCQTGLACAGIDATGLGRCAARCDDDAGCPEGALCTAARLCLGGFGDVAEGEPCDAERRCGEGLACALENGLCARLCEPGLEDAAASGCEVDERCVSRASGLGLCLTLCE